jgi:peptidoglycan hydrolase-like protein with peptidoglycan-binding domain
MKKYLVLAILLFSIAIVPTTAKGESTIAELQAQIAQLMAQIAAMKGGNTQTCFTFSRNLGVGSVGQDVAKLQSFLESRGFGEGITHDTDEEVTDSFGEFTAAAVVKYQASVGVIQTGYFGPLTRAKVNALCIVPPVVKNDPSITASRYQIKSGESVNFVTSLPKGASYGGFELRCASDLVTVANKWGGECEKTIKFYPKAGEHQTWQSTFTLKNYLSSQPLKVAGEVYAYDASGNITGKGIIWVEVSPNKDSSQPSVDIASWQIDGSGEKLRVDWAISNLPSMNLVGTSYAIGISLTSATEGKGVALVKPCVGSAASDCQYISGWERKGHYSHNVSGITPGRYYITVQLLQAAIVPNAEWSVISSSISENPIIIGSVTQPSITSVSPYPVVLNQNVTLVGSGFTATGNSINFSGTRSGKFVGPSADGKTLVFTAGGGVMTPGTYKIIVSNSNGTTNSMPLTVTSGTVSTCPAPYHVLTSDNRCVWSCSVGTTPNNATNECSCQSGLTQTGTDSFGRRTCSDYPVTSTATTSAQSFQLNQVANALQSLQKLVESFKK